MTGAGGNSESVSRRNGVSGYSGKQRKKDWFYSKCFKGMECSVITCREVYGLDLHHGHYFNLGAEQNGDLVLLCRAHHEKIHEIEGLGVKLTKATNMVLDDKVIEF